MSKAPKMVDKKNQGVSLPLKKIPAPVVPKGQPRPKEYGKGKSK